LTYPGTAQTFWVPQIISGTGKTTKLQIVPKHSQRPSEQKRIPDKSSLKILDKRERGHIHWLPNLFGCLLLSQK